MAGESVVVAAVLLMVGGCHRDNPGIGCAGAVVLITVTPSPATDARADASSPGDGEYLEALRVAIEGATPANCVRRPVSTVLACAPRPASPEACARDTVDATTSLEPQIRDYLAASWPEIDPTAVSLDTCVCHID